MRILNDPLYKAPDPHETLQSLLKAAKVQQSRWSALLIAIGLEPSFQMPRYDEPKPEVWTRTKEQAAKEGSAST